MAAIEKRTSKTGKTTYRVKVRLKGFATESATFDRLTDAREWAKKIEADMKAGRHFGQSKRHTFNELADEYLQHAMDKKRLEYWRKAFGQSLLADIAPSRISKERDKLLSEETRRYASPPTGNPELDATRSRSKRSGATVNRYIAALSSCLSYGVKTLEWLERNPCERVKKPKESNGRVRYLSEDEVNRLLDACQASHNKDLYLAVVLSLTTGARQEEIMSLRWKQIDFQQRVIMLTRTKNGDQRALPLAGQAFSFLHERSKVRSLVDDRVFPSSIRAKKSDYLDLRQPWEKALTAAEIKDFRWHDLRHTAASYLAMEGGSLIEITKLLGHRTIQMALRYAHLSSEHIARAGEKLASRLGVN